MAWTKDQEKAIETFGKDIIVSAGAGSGKTAVLSERVLEHVKNGIDIEEMLILTFTNLAAGEMRDRIRSKLIKAGFNDQAERVDLAYITTFDSYALSILKRYNQYLNISDKVSIIDSSIIELKKKEILENIFEGYYKNKNELFLKLIDDFCMKDDKEIFDTILELNSKLDNRFDKREFLNNYIDNYYQDSNINIFTEEYLGILNKKVKQIRMQIDNLSNYVEVDFIYKMEECFSSLFKAKSYEEIKFNSNLNMPRMNKASDEAKLIKSEIKNIVDSLKEMTKYNSLKEIRDNIYKTRGYAKVIVELILRLDEEIFEFKKSICCFEFVDIAKMAISILRDNEEIRNELKYSYKEILIDEYQDTNDLQDLFISYIENNNVYMVGDIKQSIYRFRNANPMLFKKKYDDYSDGVLGEKIDLNKNFRSRSEVLDGINLIFNFIMDKTLGGADYLLEHQMVFGLEPYNKVNKEDYKMEFLNYTLDEESSFSKEEIEVFTIARDIENKVKSHFQVMDKDSMSSRDINYSDFVILIASSSKFLLYKKIFEYLNIPITVMRDKAITDSIDLAIIKNIYSLIIHIYEKNYNKDFSYSFMAVSRSYLINENDNNILEIIKDKKYYDSELFKKCKKIADMMDEISNKEIYQMIIEEFDIYNKLVLIGDVKEHLIVYDSIGNIINNMNNLGYTPIDFYGYLIDVFNNGLNINLSLNKESSNSVKIMTIHASKGLEYPICYFPGLSDRFNIGDLKNKFYYSNDYGIVMPYFENGGLYNSIVKDLLRNKYFEEEIAEKLRLFYVGLTRAREKMIFVGHFEENILAYKDNGVVDDNTRLSYRKFSDIIDSIYGNLKSYMKNVEIDKLGMTKAYNFSRYSNYKDSLKDGKRIIVNEVKVINNVRENVRYSKNSHDLLDKEEKKNVELGLRMHYLLEMIDFNNPLLDDMSDYERELVRGFLDTNVYKDARKIYKEVEFVSEDDKEMKVGVIDLLLEFDDKNIIIDYKLKNTTDDAYVKQLSGYKKYVDEISGKDSEIYLYSIMDKELVRL